MKLLSKLKLPYGDDITFQILCFAVFFVPLVFYAGAYEKFETIKIVLWSLCLSAEIFYVAAHKQAIHINKIIGILFAIFIFWLCISAIPAANGLYAIFGSSLRYIGVIFFVIFILFTLFLSSGMRGDKEKIIFLFKLLCVDALLISVFGIIQAYGITYYIGMDTVGTVLRGPSFTGNADYTGIFLSAAIPFNFFLLYVEKSKKLKYFWAVILFINIFGLVMAGSRAALVAVSFELGILLIVGLIKFRKKIIVVSALSIAVMAALCALFLPVYRNGISDSSSVNARLIVWNDAVLSIIKHPVLGIGLGQVVFTIPGDVHNYFDDVHNLFLQIGVTGGLPSLACLIAVLGYVFYIDWRMVLSKYTDDDAKNLIICLLIAELGFVIAVCFSPVPSSAWIVLSVLIASQTAVISQGNSWQEHSWLKVESYRWFYYVLGTFLFLYALAFLVGEVALYQGMYSTVDGPANQKQSMFYENLSRHIYPDEFMSSYDYIRQFIYLNKNNSDESRRKIAEYAKLYASAPAARWQLSDLYDQLYSQTHADEDLKSLIYYRTDELKSNPGVANVALSLATVYNGNGELEKANQVIHDTLEEPGLDNPQTLWIFLAKIENEEDKSPSTVIADLRAAYLSDTTNLQLKHLLEQSKKDPSVAIKYVLGGH